MARKALLIRAMRTPKFQSRVVRRCSLCGRGKGYMRDFDMCRICFREQAHEGNIPGVKKSSW
jgi:small subunit ribosomal protein S14